MTVSQGADADGPRLEMCSVEDLTRLIRDPAVERRRRLSAGVELAQRARWWREFPIAWSDYSTIYPVTCRPLTTTQAAAMTSRFAAKSILMVCVRRNAGPSKWSYSSRGSTASSRFSTGSVS